MSYSVIIPTRNRPDLLRKSLLSVAHQTLPPRRVFIVDNSTSSQFSDQTKVVVRDFNTSCPFPFSYYYLPHCATASQARNYPIPFVDTLYTAFLDDDDYWHPHKMRIMLNRFSYDTKLLSCDSYLVDSSFHKLHKRLIKHSPDHLNVRNSFGGFSNIVVETSLLYQLSFFNPYLKSCQDWDFYLRASKITKLSVVPYPLVYYRADTSSKISNNRRQLYLGFRSFYFTHNTTLRGSSDVIFLLLLHRFRYYNDFRVSTFILLLSKSLHTYSPFISLLRCVKLLLVSNLSYFG